MSTTAPLNLRTDPGEKGEGRAVLAAIDPGVCRDEVVELADSHAQPDGLVVVTSVFPPRPLVSHYWFMSDFGSTFWPDDKALPDDDMSSMERALELLDHSGTPLLIEKVRRPEALFRRSRRRLVAKALVDAAVRHDAEAIVVGAAAKPGRSIASYLRDLTDRTVIEAPVSVNPAGEGALVEVSGREPG